MSAGVMLELAKILQKVENAGENGVKLDTTKIVAHPQSDMAKAFRKAVSEDLITTMCPLHSPNGESGRLMFTPKGQQLVSQYA